MFKKFSLSFYGIEKSDQIDCTGLSKKEIDRELVGWVLDQVDYWSGDSENIE